MIPHFSKFPKKYATSIKCTVLPRLFVHIVLKRSSVLPQRYIINLRETIQAEATSLIPQLRKLIMQKSKA